MKKSLFALLAGASLMLAGAARADVVNFDGLATAGDFASLGDISPYAGLNWSTDWYAGDNSIAGYANGAHSGANFAVNGFGGDAAGISSTTPFSFAGAWFAAPQGVDDKAGWVNITAYDAADHVIGSTGNVAISVNYLWVAGGFNNVSRLSVTRDSGWYVMDDFAAAAAPVPEPGMPLMLGAGLLVLGLAGRRARR
ncbi:hypothetical protein [Rugamonas rivuli]|uniref:PEP-CTERM sorting domain-containing protein n=1 Tax=Rugamonas rivuli TaxID=2743358 RepID=A0A843SD75_9BURK|nr:hypothetical protein [Rugamonas rivuli]MQA18476.1 hypothetical protein [Rugamonas rivuli]